MWGEHGDNGWDLAKSILLEVVMGEVSLLIIPVILILALISMIRGLTSMMRGEPAFTTLDLSKRPVTRRPRVDAGPKTPRLA